MQELQIYLNSRGMELPGNYNHVLLGELFHVQSSRWKRIAEDHVLGIYDRLQWFVRAVLEHITNDENVIAELLELTHVPLSRSKADAMNELEQLCEDERQQPITYNHYYTDNIQRSRQDSLRKFIRTAVNDTNKDEWGGKMHISNNIVDAQKLTEGLQRRVEVNMTAQACVEALDGLAAYYKVSANHMTLWGYR